MKIPLYNPRLIFRTFPADTLYVLGKGGVVEFSEINRVTDFNPRPVKAATIDDLVRQPAARRAAETPSTPEQLAEGTQPMLDLRKNYRLRGFPQSDVIDLHVKADGSMYPIHGRYKERPGEPWRNETWTPRMR